ncbi:MAG: hypothetical protein E7012_05145 [Alphaproteobacteria bacterium]|nr:hypothetical protein [Alphaproteobacteria bacterium]
MVLQFFLSLLTVAGIFMVVPYKRRIVWLWLLFTITVCLSVWYLYDMANVARQIIEYKWISYPHLRADFIIGGDSPILSSIFNMIPILFLFLWMNLTFFPKDTSLSASNITLLLLATFIYTLSSQDNIQLMVGSCCFSILGFYLINDSNLKKHFILYSYTAEISIFTALAVIYSQVGNINFNDLGKYIRIGKHHDLVSLLLMVGIFIKCGTFLFQNYIIELNKLNFNRMLIISLLSSPLSGLIIFYKLHSVISASSYFTSTLNTVVVLTSVWSLLGIIWRDSLKAKILYLNMMFFAISLFLISKQAENIFIAIKLLPLLTIIDISLYPVSLYGFTDPIVSKNSLNWYHHKSELLISFVAYGMLLISSQSSIPFYFTIMLAIANAIIISGLYGLKERPYVSWLSKFMPYILPLALGGVWFVLIDNFKFEECTIYVFIGFVLCSLFTPQRFINLLADKTDIQDGDFFSTFYHSFIISPLRLLGRILWLLVDFIVIERSLIGNFSDTTLSGIGYLQKIQSKGLISWLCFFGLGLLILIINIGIFVYE